MILHYTTVLGVCAVVGDAEAALNMLADRHKLKSRPYIISGNTTLNLFDVKRDMRATTRMVDSMKGLACHHNDRKHNAIINLAAFTGKCCAALEFVQTVTRTDIPLLR